MYIYTFANCPIQLARRTGRKDIVEYLLHFGPKAARDTRTAACAGDLAFLKDLRRHGFPWHEDTCEVAAARGSLECLRYAHENGSPWNPRVCSEAAGNGHIDCVLYARQNGCPWDVDVVYYALHNRSLTLLRGVLAAGAPIPGDACTLTASNGEIEHLRLLNEYGASWDEGTTSAAAKCGQFTTLKYAFDNGCPYNQDVVQHACASGDVSCLQFLVEDQGLYMDGSVFAIAITHTHLHCVRYLIGVGCPFPDFFMDWKPIVHCQDEALLACVKCAVESGWELPVFRDRLLLVGFDRCYAYITEVQQSMAQAAEVASKVAAVPLVVAQPVPGRLQVDFNRACAQGDIRAMRDAILVDDGLNLGVHHLTAAVEMGRFDCVILLISSGCLFDSTVTKAAVRGGHFEIFGHAIRNGCTCDKETTIAIVSSDLQPYLQLLFEHGFCEDSTDLFEAALVWGSHACMRYIIEVINYSPKHYVYVEPSDTTVPIRVLDDGAMCKCLAYAAEAGWKWNVGFLQFLRENDCVQSRAYLLERQGKCDATDCVHFTHSLGDHGACARYNSECWSAPVVISSHASACAVREMAYRAWFIVGSYGCVECAKNLYDQWVPGKYKAVIAATKAGHQHCLTFLLEHGCPTDETVAAAAAGKGYVMCLHALYKFGCAYDVTTANAAAQHGKVKTLHYAVVRMGCPIDCNTAKLAAAAESGSVECLQCLIEVGLELPEDGAVFGAALSRADVDCVSYLLKVGCPFKNFRFDSESGVIPRHKDTNFSVVLCLPFTLGIQLMIALCILSIDLDCPLVWSISSK